MRQVLALLASYGALAGCTGRDLTAPLAVPSSPAATQSPVATGTVSWMAPLGTGTADPATFDAAVAPQIQICVWVGGACSGTPIALFATAASPGVSLITINSTAGAYEASWSLLSTSFTTRRTYRIRVLQGATETGAVSVDVVRGRWALTRTDGTLAPLTTANTLPIHFHIASVSVSRTIDAAGGVLLLPDGAQITIPAGIVQGRVTIQWLAPPKATSHYLSLAARDYRLVIPLTSASGTFAATGTIRVSVPTTRSSSSGSAAYFRSTFSGVPGNWWAVANEVSGTLILDIPVGGFANLSAILGMQTLDVTLAAEEFTAPTAASSSNNAALYVVPASSRAALSMTAPGTDISRAAGINVPTGTTRGCPLTPMPLPPAYAPCGQLSLRLATWSPTPKPGQAALVLVHGWKAEVADEVDYYEEQGMYCDRIIWRCGELPWGNTGGELPGEAYFTSLLSQIRADFPTTPVYIVDYQSYLDYHTNGNALAAALEAEQGAQQLAGFVLVGHSMGGLVARYATRVVEHTSQSVVLGNITLATPHLGTPLPTLGVNLGIWGLSVPTEGTQSLGIPLLKTELAPLFASGGNIASDAYSHGIKFWWLYGLLKDPQLNPPGFPKNDGVVPISSALPPGFSGPGVVLHGEFGTYDHTQMAGGKSTAGDASLGQDPVYVALKSDMQTLLAARPPSQQPIEVPGSVAWQGSGSNEGFCIMSKYLSPIAADGIRTWTAHLTKGAIYPVGTSLRDDSDINALSCEQSLGIYTPASVAGASAPGDQIFLTLIEPGGNAIYAVWTWDGTKMIARRPSAETALTTEFSPGISSIARSGTNLYYFTLKQWSGCNSQSLEAVSTGGGPITPLARNINCAYAIATDGAYVYWTEITSTGNGFIKRVSVRGGTIDTLASGLGLTQSSSPGFVLDGGVLYFTATVAGDPVGVQHIQSIATTGGAITDLVSTAVAPSFAVSNGMLYYENADPRQHCQGGTDVGSISKLPVAKNLSPVSLGTAVLSCGGNSVLVNGATLLVNHGPASNTLSVGSTTGQVLTPRVTGLQYPTGLVTDGAYVFLSENGTIVRYDVSTFQRTVVSWWRDAYSPIIDANYLYWASPVRLLDNCCGGGHSTSIIRVPR